MKNEKIPENALQIYFGKNTYCKKEYHLIVTLVVNDKTTLQEYVYSESEDNINKTVQFILDKSEFKYLHRKTIEVEIWKPRKYLVVAPNLKGRFSIKLGEFKSKSVIENKFKIEIESKRMEPEYFVSCKIRQSLVEKELKDVVKPVFNLTKTYPIFDKNKDYSENADTGVKIDEAKLQQQLQQKPKDKEIIVKPQTHQKAPEKQIVDNTEVKESNKTIESETTEKIDSSQFNEIELKDPDDVDCMNSLVVLETRLKLLEQEIKNIEGRTPMNIRQKKIKLSCKLNMLKSSIESGDLNLDSYVKMLVSQYQRDVKLAKYFNQIKDSKKFEIVNKRLTILKKEMDEGLAMIKK